MKKLLSVILIIIMLVATLAYADDEEIPDENVDEEASEFVDEEASEIIDVPTVIQTQDISPSQPEPEKIENNNSDEFNMLVAFGIFDAAEALDEYFTKAQLDKVTARLNKMEWTENEKSSEPATVGEMCRAMVNVLGCEYAAIGRGGYPDGYILTAADAGISGTYLNPDEKLTSVTAVKMIINTLNADCMRLTKVFGDNKRFEKYGTLLNTRFNIYKSEGIVDADKYTDLLSPQSSVRDGYIAINGVPYLSEIFNNELLGHRVLYYYREENDEKTVVYADLLRSNELNINAEDIISADKNEIKYTENSDDFKAEISKTASFIYNYKYTDITKEKLIPRIGNIVLIDNDNDGLYDVVKIFDYKTAFVSGVKANDYLISDEITGSTIQFSQNDDIFIEEDGKSVNFSAITQNSIVSYIISSGEGKNISHILVSKTSIYGVVQCAYTDDKKVTIDGIEYNMTADEAERLPKGFVGTLYFDSFSNVAYHKLMQNGVYGFLNKISVSDMDDIQMRIFTEYNRWVSLDVEPKIKYNGTSGIPAKNVVNGFGESYRQMVVYKVNPDGKIYELNTAVSVENFSDEEEKLRKDNIFRCNGSVSSVSYSTTNYSFNSVYYPTSDTKLFDVSSDANNEEDFHILTRSDLQGGQKYSVTFYDCNSVMQPSVCLIYNMPVYIQNSGAISSFMIVDSVAKSLTFDGEDNYIVKGTYKGSNTPYEIRTKSKTEIDSLGGVSKGDVIQFAINSSGYVEKVSILYKNDSLSPQKFANGAVSSTFCQIAGEVRDIDYFQSMMTVKYSATDYAVLSAASIRNVYVFYMQSKRVEKGTIYDILKSDNIFATARYGLITEIIIFR